jgi:hypothetical protein
LHAGKFFSFGERQKDFNAVSSMASELKYTKEQVDAMLKDVEESYDEDRDKGLIEAAFGKSRSDQTAS